MKSKDILYYFNIMMEDFFEEHPTTLYKCVNGRYEHDNGYTIEGKKYLETLSILGEALDRYIKARIEH